MSWEEIVLKSMSGTSVTDLSMKDLGWDVWIKTSSINTNCSGLLMNQLSEGSLAGFAIHRTSYLVFVELKTCGERMIA